MSEHDDTIALLEAAAARLDAFGWTRGTAGPHAGPNCLAGALSWAADDTRVRQVLNARTAWHRANGIQVPMVGWNDRVCPDGATAADSLRLAAKWLAGHVPAGRD